mgnify:CR=1 FL=1
MKKLLLIVLSVILCLVLAGCKNEENPQIEPSENLDSITESFFDEPIEDNEYESSSSGTLLFTTEYEVVDYVENAIIVSKNDGLLYGVLDNSGNIVIPVSYDSIWFLNKNDYINGNADIYILATYENVNFIFNKTGKQIYETNNAINYADCIFKTIDSPFFAEITESKIDYYTEDFEFVGSVDALGYSISGGYNVLSNQCCIVAKLGSIDFYDFKGNLINSLPDYYIWYKTKTDKGFVLLLTTATMTNNKIIYLDNFGNIIEEENITSKEEAEEKFKKIEKENSTQNYNLYQSNSTWKLEDLNGNSLYDDRYYKRVHPSGQNECIFLTDEDNYVTTIGRKGNRYIGSGVIEFDGARVYLLGFNGRREIEAVHEGKDSIILTTNTSYGTNIYYYE